MACNTELGEGYPSSEDEEKLGETEKIEENFSDHKEDESSSDEEETMSKLEKLKVQKNQMNEDLKWKTEEISSFFSGCPNKLNAKSGILLKDILGTDLKQLLIKEIVLTHVKNDFPFHIEISTENIPGSVNNKRTPYGSSSCHVCQPFYSYSDNVKIVEVENHKEGLNVFKQFPTWAIHNLDQSILDNVSNPTTVFVVKASPVFELMKINDKSNLPVLECPKEAACSALEKTKEFYSKNNPFTDLEKAKIKFSRGKFSNLNTKSNQWTSNEEISESKSHLLLNTYKLYFTMSITYRENC